LEKPDWLRIKAPTGQNFARMRELTRSCGASTVCDASHCPNICDCWSRGHATFLLLGPRCTRSCAFCAVESGVPAPPDREEPLRVARAVRTLGLRYVVITSVTRDDLGDHGAGHFAEVVERIGQESPGTRVELLIPDMGSSLERLSTVVTARPAVIGHNMETVARLQPVVRDRRSNYLRSLETLRTLKEIGPALITKSSLMLGLGERYEEVVETLHDLRSAGVEAVTMGQYLKPRGGRLEVKEYVRPEVFDRLRVEAVAMGFRHAVAAPFVRSSFNAHELFDEEGENIADRRL
jgi:lipoyl synthase